MAKFVLFRMVDVQANHHCLLAIDSQLPEVVLGHCRANVAHFAFDLGNHAVEKATRRFLYILGLETLGNHAKFLICQVLDTSVNGLVVCWGRGERTIIKTGSTRQIEALTVGEAKKQQVHSAICVVFEQILQDMLGGAFDHCLCDQLATSVRFTHLSMKRLNKIIEHLLIHARIQADDTKTYLDRLALVVRSISIASWRWWGELSTLQLDRSGVYPNTKIFEKRAALNHLPHLSGLGDGRFSDAQAQGKSKFGNAHRSAVEVV